ncbi:MAG: tyrosine-type recombinase/integrase [Gammaproteobacteria bacterium]|nr:tyrosine-type recombinase/integrase [Gammaproteobacteria bacterium]
MGRQARTPGLFLRGEVWHIDKRTKYAPEGRLRESTGESEIEEAEACLARRLAELKGAVLYGERIRHAFEEAATRYLREYDHLASILDQAIHLKQVMPFIGALPVDQVDSEALEPFILHERQRGLRPKSINNAIGVVHRVLNLCARKWRDKVGDGRKVPWCDVVPLLERVPVTGKGVKPPYPLDWTEQDRLFQELPPHLERMALYKVNVGCREQEVCQLRWEWEVNVPELDVSVFLVPAWIMENEETEVGLVKNRQDRLHVISRIARAVVEEAREKRPKTHLPKCTIHNGGACNCAYSFVFGYKGYRVTKMHNSGWKSAWKRAGLPSGENILKGVHNLKHTCGRRLRAAGVGEKTRKVILGHRDGDITSHYSAAEIGELLDAVERITNRGTASSPNLTVLKRRQSPQNAHSDLEAEKTG